MSDLKLSGTLGDGWPATARRFPSGDQSRSVTWIAPRVTCTVAPAAGSISQTWSRRISASTTVASSLSFSRLARSSDFGSLTRSASRNPSGDQAKPLTLPLILAGSHGSPPSGRISHRRSPFSSSAPFPPGPLFPASRPDRKAISDPSGLQRGLWSDFGERVRRTVSASDAGAAGAAPFFDGPLLPAGPPTGVR